MTTESVTQALEAQEARLAALEETQRDGTGYCLLPSPGEGPAILRPILDAEHGLRWCCTHASEHCSRPLAAR